MSAKTQKDNTQGEGPDTDDTEKHGLRIITVGTWLQQGRQVHRQCVFHKASSHLKFSNATIKLSVISFSLLLSSFSPSSHLPVTFVRELLSRCSVVVAVVFAAVVVVVLNPASADRLLQSKPAKLRDERTKVLLLRVVFDDVAVGCIFDDKQGDEEVDGVVVVDTTS